MFGKRIWSQEIIVKTGWQFKLPPTIMTSQSWILTPKLPTALFVTSGSRWVAVTPGQKWAVPRLSRLLFFRNLSCIPLRILMVLIVFGCKLVISSLVAQLVKNTPAMQETPVWSLGWEDPLEKEKATHSSILAWRTSWTVYSMENDWETFTSLPLWTLGLVLFFF